MHTDPGAAVHKLHGQRVVPVLGARVVDGEDHEAGQVSPTRLGDVISQVYGSDLINRVLGELPADTDPVQFQRLVDGEYARPRQDVETIAFQVSRARSRQLQERPRRRAARILFALYHEILEYAQQPVLVRCEGRRERPHRESGHQILCFAGVVGLALPPRQQFVQILTRSGLVAVGPAHEPIGIQIEPQGKSNQGGRIRW